MRTSLSQLVAWYRGLSPAVRRTVAVLLGAEVALIAVTERDIHRRPARRLRGPKWLWRVVATQNVVGPAAYYALGRRA